MSALETRYNQVKAEVRGERKRRIERNPNYHPNLDVEAAIGLYLISEPLWSALAAEAKQIAEAQHFRKAFRSTEQREEALKAQPGGSELLHLYFQFCREEDERQGIKDEGITDHGYW